MYLRNIKEQDTLARVKFLNFALIEYELNLHFHAGQPWLVRAPLDDQRSVR